MRSTLTALVAVVALVVCPGCGSDGGGSTPEATFNAMKAAADAKDMRKFMKCLTPESQDMMVGGVVAVAVMTTEMAKAMGGKSDADMEALLKKHNVSGADVKAMNPSSMEAGMKQLAAKVKDKPGFMADFAALAEKKGKKEGVAMTGGAEGTLKDVKITGDTAKGTVVTTKDGKETTDTIEFRKVDGRWLIHMVPPTK
ncbi:MAG: DUF4878 domain-containing protein [Planctomycetota bacterium]|jgi:hypothetical protein